MTVSLFVILLSNALRVVLKPLLNLWCGVSPLDTMTDNLERFFASGAFLVARVLD